MWRSLWRTNKNRVEIGELRSGIFDHISPQLALSVVSKERTEVCMELNLDGRVFRRVNNPAVHILVTGWSGIMVFGALQGLTDDFATLPMVGWGDSPVGIFGIVFVLFWFAFVGGFVWAGVSGLMSVHIGRSGVAMKLWFIPIRELDVTEIKTVVKVFQRDTSRLVLLTDTAEELREKI